MTRFQRLSTVTLSLLALLLGYCIGCQYGRPINFWIASAVFAALPLAWAVIYRRQPRDARGRFTSPQRFDFDNA